MDVSVPKLNQKPNLMGQCIGIWAYLANCLTRSTTVGSEHTSKGVFPFRFFCDKLLPFCAKKQAIKAPLLMPPAGSLGSDDDDDDDDVVASPFVVVVVVDKKDGDEEEERALVEAGSSEDSAGEGEEEAEEGEE